MESILEVQELTVTYPRSNRGRIPLDGVSFCVPRGEILGVAGESGAGKTTLALAILNLAQFYRGRISGKVLFQGRDLVKLSASELRAVRGRDIAMVFQNAHTSLDPLCRVGDQIREVILAHQALDRGAIERRIADVLREAQLDPFPNIQHLYPHELSGGMAQRVLIAMALANSPSLLIADEPTSSVDVTTQRDLLDLFRRLNRDKGLTILFISHDLHVLSEISTHLLVMRNGKIAEQGPTRDLLTSPKTSYVRDLIAAVPRWYPS